MICSNEWRIVVLGKTGVGKSAVANSILGCKYFRSQASNESVTYQCDATCVNVDNTQMFVVDTPGFQDTRGRDQMVRQEVTKAIHNLSPGPHIFLIVLSPSRFTQEESDCIREMESFFGDRSFYRFAIVVFTRKQEIFEDDPHQDLNAFIRNRVNPQVQEVIRLCNGRVLTVENYGDFPKSATEELRNYIAYVIQMNRGSFYNHEYFTTMAEMQRQRQSIQTMQMQLTHLAEQSGRRSRCTIL